MTETTNEPEAFDADYVASLRTEAADARGALREAQNDLETAQGQLVDYRRGEMVSAIEEANTTAAGRKILANVADLVDRTEDLDSLRDDDGKPDPQAIRTAISQLATDRPHLRPFVPDMSGDLGPKPIPVFPGEGPASWASVFHGAKPDSDGERMPSPIGPPPAVPGDGPAPRADAA